MGSERKEAASAQSGRQKGEAARLKKQHAIHELPQQSSRLNIIGQAHTQHAYSGARWPASS